MDTACNLSTEAALSDLNCFTRFVYKNRKTPVNSKKMPLYLPIKAALQITYSTL